MGEAFQEGIEIAILVATFSASLVVLVLSVVLVLAVGAWLLKKYVG